MAQLVTRVDDALIEQLDEMVDAGEVNSRSEAVRRALKTMIDQRRRHLIGEAIAEAYRRTPLTEDELRWADAGTRSMIAEEPWERW